MFSLSGIALFSLFALANSLAPAKIREENVPLFVQDVSEVVESHPELNLFPKDKNGLQKTKKIVIVWDIFESGGQKGAIGDNGNACGVAQVHKHYWYGYSCSQILEDRKLGIYLGLRAMKELSVQFHSVRIGLAAFAGGNQYKSARVQKLVEDRMKVAE